jgi:hypothetical protein
MSLDPLAVEARNFPLASSRFMTHTFEVIERFSHRPLLRTLACDVLQTALKQEFPGIEIDPAAAAITRVTAAGKPVAETLNRYLQQSFALGKTVQLQPGKNALVSDIATSATVQVDLAQLALVIDSVALDLLDLFTQALVDFWSTPSGDGISPGECLACFLAEQHSPSEQDDSSGADRGDRLAQAILDQQLLAIQGARSLGLGNFDEIERCVQAMTDIAQAVGDQPPTPGHAAVTRLEQLPDWLKTASSVDRLDYSRRLTDVATANGQAAGKSFDDGLPPIMAYARKALQDQLCADHPDAVGLTLDDVTMTIAKVVASAIPSAGQIFNVGTVEPVRMSPAAFALDNLASLPNGAITLTSKQGDPLPDWLTPDYLKLLVCTVDVGRTYPALLRSALITDGAQVARRRALFAEQLRVQLPLKALEQKLRGEGAITQAGYRRVCAALQPSAPLAPASSSVLRPLAFVVEPGAVADQVSNLFVFGAADISVGPFVLYRPFAPLPLMEFASWSALRQAIAQPGELQDEVLTWMTGHARQRYGEGGFDQPHTVRFGSGSDFAPLETPEPAQLATARVDGDVFVALFDANAQAWATLADRDAVSNAQSRWALIKRGGWLALDTVMPFIGGAPGSALWLVQLLVGVDEVLVAESRPEKAASVEAWNSLLLTVSLILLHQGFTPRLAPSRRPAVAGLDVAAGSVAVPKPSAAPDGLGRGTVLDFSWSSVSQQLSRSQADALKRFSLAPAPELEPSELHPGLYEHGGKTYARIDSAVYQVVVAEDEVRIVDAQDTEAHGPRLKRIGKVWSLDLTLRLRGGGPKRSARQLAQENAATLKRVNEQKAVLKARLGDLYSKITKHDALLFKMNPASRSQGISLAESDLTQAVETYEQLMALDEKLRPGDRFSDKVLGQALRELGRRIALVEGLLLQEMLGQAKNEMAALTSTSSRTVISQNVEPYLAMFERLLDFQNRGVHWSTVRERFWQRLRAVPKVGEGFWREDVLTLHQSHLFTRLDWTRHRFWSLLEMSVSPDGILTGLGALEVKRLRVDEPLHAAFSSHAALEKPHDYSVAEQISVLESSLREYDRASLIAISALETEPEALVLARFRLFMEDLSWISDLAEKRLSDLIRESEEPPGQPSEYLPTFNQPRKRVFKTQAQRTLVGRLRTPAEAEFPGEMIDVTEPASDKIIGTYHKHAERGWVEVDVVRPARPVSQPPAVPLEELMRQAGAGLKRVEPDIASAVRQSQRANEPEDMQDILVQKAEKLTALADKLALHTDGGVKSGTETSEADALIAQLRAGAARLADEGRSIRVAMIKAQPPTAARVNYLYRQREIDIASFDGRKNLSGPRRNDFMQEYVIRDKDQRELWWAHFHYASETASAEAFTAAHLKLPHQRFLGYKALVRAAKDNKAVVNVYRSAIGKDLAQRLFLGLTPDPQPAAPTPEST